MTKKTFFGNEINFNKTPILWTGIEVYPGDGATSNFYGSLNVIKNPEETITPDINTDGNVNVKKSVNVNQSVNVNANVIAYGEVYSNGGAHILSTKKNFDIPHPTKEGWRLTHSCVEGPEAAVYVRGKLMNKNIIKLPEYWKKLVDPDTITVSITPISYHQDILVRKINNIEVVLESKENIDICCFYHVYGERIDTEKLISEYEGDIEDYPGDNSERSIVGYHYDKKVI
jgi:hypothetical protein